ncbi:MAG: L-serine ammonia-lyase [Crocinitomicaceae bacterium]
MEYISTFDMLKIGVGPSSSHTLGPWRAAEKWIDTLKNSNTFHLIQSIKIDLYGSLSLTGKGHATDLAIMLGLSGADPEYIPVEDIKGIISNIEQVGKLRLGGEKEIFFDPSVNIEFNAEFLPFHANGMKFTAFFNDKKEEEEYYFSIGGGFIVQEKNDEQAVEIQNAATYPYPIQNAKQLAHYCTKLQVSISDIVFENEKVLRSAEEIDNELRRIWETMLESIYIGCHTEGVLPGGLNVRRRAFDTHQRLIGDVKYNSKEEWIEAIRSTEVKFRQILKWVSCFALAVNEVNASLGRVVTAPTNGSAGVIPAVLMYYLTIENHDADFKDVKKFLLTAGEIGSIFKKGSTISAAMGGCQAEIGVSSAMAAAALTEAMGGSPEQAMVAAEIAMEHHLGMTCDPIGGLVQIPCIERNSMGAIKAINAAELAMDTDPKNVKVPLDEVIETMWETAKDMNSKYKETSQGGLAVRVILADC